MSPADVKPLFTVVSGNPSETEVGILAAVFASASGNAASANTPEAGVRDSWGNYEERLRGHLSFNPRSYNNTQYF